MKIEFSFLGKKQTLHLKKMNFIFGYSSSGKSGFCEFLNDGFQGKNYSQISSFGFPIPKGEYEVIYLNNKSNLIDEFKLKKASFLRLILTPIIEKWLYDDTFINNSDFSRMLGNINFDIQIFLDEINDLIKLNNVKSSINIDSMIDTIISLLVFNFDNQEERASDAISKEFLYYIVLKYISLKQGKYVLIIDDFDISFDQETTLRFIKNCQSVLEKSNIFCFFTTSKAQILSKYLIKTDGCFALRNNQFYDIRNIDKIIELESIRYNQIAISYEDAILNYPFLENREIEDVKRAFYEKAEVNIGRMVTNKNYSLDFEEGKVKIFYQNELEKKIISSFNEFINS